MANKKPIVKGLLDHAKKKSEIAKQNVDIAIKRMLKKQQKINFNTVAEEAAVSTGFLYKHSEIRERIEKLRKQQEGLLPSQVKRNTSDQSKDVIIASLRKRIALLEEENKTLKKQVSSYLSKVYEQI